MSMEGRASLSCLPVCTEGKGRVATACSTLYATAASATPSHQGSSATRSIRSSAVLDLRRLPIVSLSYRMSIQKPSETILRGICAGVETQPRAFSINWWRGRLPACQPCCVAQAVLRRHAAPDVPTGAGLPSCAIFERQSALFRPSCRQLQRWLGGVSRACVRVAERDSARRSENRLQPRPVDGCHRTAGLSLPRQAKSFDTASAVARVPLAVLVPAAIGRAHAAAFLQRAAARADRWHATQIELLPVARIVRCRRRGSCPPEGLHARTGSARHVRCVWQPAKSNVN